MNPAELSQTLLALVRRVVAERATVPDLVVGPEDVTLERPKNREHGDWASSVAMKLGKRIGVNPRDFASGNVASGRSSARKDRKVCSLGRALMKRCTSSIRPCVRPR